ncbi:MAG TPA: M20/M25/M40 family metallo-hydrolase [Myxococcaceae bacterium]|nr:M20/M25/M40 family metallo-hydrolase [Myxococcaceae bacterium]
MDRRTFLRNAAVGAVGLVIPGRISAADDLAGIRAEIEKRHDEAVKRLQQWIAQPTIAAEKRGIDDGCELMIRMLRDAGFTAAKRIPSDGVPGVLATLDAGAPRTLGMYFMYDVKQADPAEWSSPPWEGRVVDKAGFGKVIVGRGAVNQKGPEATFLAALHAIRGAGRKVPVNLVLVAEGEEEIGSPHFKQIVQTPEVRAALSKCSGIYMPHATQDPNGLVTITLGGKGVVELELVSSGEKWGRGPNRDIHSSLKASVDSPPWHLVQALHTLVSEDGNTPAIDGFADPARPLHDWEKKMIAEATKKRSEESLKNLLGVKRWVHDVTFLEAQERLASQPTVNIEGLVGGYTGPGGKTILPHRAVAKIDLRLVPNMTAAGALDALKKHLAKRGFADIEVNMTGGYDPTTTSADSPLIRAEQSVYRKLGVESVLWPRSGGSWPGYVFTGEPLRLAAGHFGLGHGSGAHAPDEYYVIDSSNPRIQGMDGAVLAHVQYLYELAAAPS